MDQEVASHLAMGTIEVLTLFEALGGTGENKE